MKYKIKQAFLGLMNNKTAQLRQNLKNDNWEIDCPYCGVMHVYTDNPFMGIKESKCRCGECNRSFRFKE